jgi:hypothetical protein
MVEGDECISYKCKYAVCSFRPPSLDVSTGICAQKKKIFSTKSNKPKPRREDVDDPLKYRKMLSKKMKKDFKIKEFY